ncbi:hypothetical protein VCUG_02325 [Vavraia culicis subsp. floridensis]|uniref:Exonuclease domain-containing protein n=1 Tax=Vavraia culicis (isolate floridensis) TaxID=948595 RepID=L2GRC9_VAVCU|nr:uncharacterized protein VCUG_02325 [Vavraia culicis subsp. floridensis]ELA46189.1 hypothetical protein VCUG_02325 [Vavraia culicis subsp. floridensis]
MRPRTTDNARLTFNHSTIKSLNIDKIRALIQSIYNFKKKPSFVKVANRWNMKSFNVLFLVDECDDMTGKMGFDGSSFVARRMPKLPPFYTVYPLQDNFSVHEIERIVFKDIGEDVRPDIGVLKHVEYFRHFVVKDPFSIYLEDDRFVNSDISVSEANKIDWRMYKRAYKHTAHKLIAMDCEMLVTDVGVELGRVTLLDIQGDTLLDIYVKTDNTVVDYRTEYSGLCEESFKQSVCFDAAQSMVLELIGIDTILLGHSLYNDLKILQINHGKLIDTSRLFRTRDNYKISLKSLANKYRCISIQNGTHCSYEDAYACLQLLSIKVRTLYELFSSERYFGFVKVDRNAGLEKLKVSERCARTAFISIRELESLDVLERVNNYYIVIYRCKGKAYAGVYDSKR